MPHRRRSQRCAPTRLTLMRSAATSSLERFLQIDEELAEGLAQSDHIDQLVRVEAAEDSFPTAEWAVRVILHAPRLSQPRA
eukprot:9045546-Heterocapsa_arctica.AAC.1